MEMKFYKDEYLNAIFFGNLTKDEFIYPVKMFVWLSKSSRTPTVALFDGIWRSNFNVDSTREIDARTAKVEIIKELFEVAEASFASDFLKQDLFSKKEV